MSRAPVVVRVASRVRRPAGAKAVPRNPISADKQDGARVRALPARGVELLPHIR